MHPGTLRALEFDRIVSVVRSLAVTPTGAIGWRSCTPRPVPPKSRPRSGPRPRAPDFLPTTRAFLSVRQRTWTPSLCAVGWRPRAGTAAPDRACRLPSNRSGGRATWSRRSATRFPFSRRLVEAVASFTGEIADVRRTIDAAGEVADDATPALAGIRGAPAQTARTPAYHARVFPRGRDTAKYLQEQVVTDRNGRYVLVVRAEHRSAVPGIVHGASASGASLFLEPLGTVDINNDIVALEEQEREEVHRILLALTDAFRGRPPPTSAARSRSPPNWM